MREELEEWKTWYSKHAGIPPTTHTKVLGLWPWVKSQFLKLFISAPKGKHHSRVISCATVRELDEDSLPSRTLWEKPTSQNQCDTIAEQNQYFLQHWVSLHFAWIPSKACVYSQKRPGASVWEKLLRIPADWGNLPARAQWKHSLSLPLTFSSSLFNTKVMESNSVRAAFAWWVAKIRNQQRYLAIDEWPQKRLYHSRISCIYKEKLRGINQTQKAQ